MPARAGAIRAGRAMVEVVADDSKLVRVLKSVQAKLRAFGHSVRQFGRQLMLAGGAAAAPLAASSKVFASFEARMARVRALTGAAGKQFSRLEAEAKRLGRTTAFSASQAAEAMSYFALAGYDVEKILGAIGPTLDLAAAGQIDIAQAADIVTKIMAGMGLEADELAGAVDIMAKAMTTANTDLGMLGEAFKYVGPMAKSAGISLEEVTAAIQLLSNAGIQGEMAGSTLRGMLLALTSPSSEAAKELARLGVRITDAEGNVRSLADIIEDLERATAQMGSGQRLATLGRIFPARQAAGAAELLSQGAAKLREATAALQDAGGTAGRIARVQLDTLSGSVTILWSAVEGLAIEVGQALAPVIRRWAEALQKAAGYVAELAKQNGELIVKIGKGAALLAGVGGAMVGLGMAAQVAAFGFGGLARIAGLASGLFAGLGKALGLVTTALAGLLSPVGIAVGAIAGLGAIILTYTNAGQQAVRWLADTFGPLADAARKGFAAIRDALAAGDIGKAAEVLWGTLKLVFAEGAAFVKGTWIELKVSLLNAMVDLWGKLPEGWRTAISTMADYWVKFTGTVKSLWAAAQHYIAKGFLHVMKLFDESVDVVAASKILDEQFQGRIAALDRQTEERRRRLKEELKQWTEDPEKAKAEIRQAADQAHAKLQADLARSRRELDRLIAEGAAVEAAERAKTKEEVRKAQGTVGGDTGPGETQRATTPGGLPSVDVRSREGLKLIARALRRGAADPQKQIAKNTEQLVNETRRQTQLMQKPSIAVVKIG